MKRMRSRRAQLIRWTSIAVAAVLVAGSLTAYVAFQLKLDSITHIAKIDTAHRPQRYNNALNLLLLGSDNRHGHNGALGGPGGANCSHTIMVPHVSPARGQAVGRNIPHGPG